MNTPPGPRTGAVAAVVLAMAVIVGFVLGHHRSHGSSKPRTLTASTSGISLRYPSSWKVVYTAPGIPGLTLKHLLLLAPTPSASANMIAGELRGGEPAPLPRSLISLTRSPPAGEVVALASGNQALRYRNVSIAGVTGELTLYAIPTERGPVQVLACHALGSASMQQCERIAASGTLGSTHSYELTPSTGYASGLNDALTQLDEQRALLRTQLAKEAPLTTLRHASERLTLAFSDGASTISALEPPLVAGRAQAVLTAAVLRARAAYAALTAAASEGEGAPVGAARTRIYEAEAAINSALENFALLAYRTG